MGAVLSTFRAPDPEQVYPQHEKNTWLTLLTLLTLLAAEGNLSEMALRRKSEGIWAWGQGNLDFHWDRWWILPASPGALEAATRKDAEIGY